MTTIEAADMILWNANFARNPVRATNRACSKVAWLARVSGKASHRALAEALHEHRHGVIRHGLGDMAAKRNDKTQAKLHSEAASRHYHMRDVQLARFRELAAKGG